MTSSNSNDVQTSAIYMAESKTPSGRMFWLSYAVICWTLVATILRTVRLPNDYSMAHWLLDYRLGLIKRGLVGSLVSMGSYLTGVSITAEVIAVLSSVVSITLCCVVLYIIYGLLRHFRLQPAVLMLALIFVSSPFVVMNTHVIGYFDALLYLLAILAVCLVFRGKLWWAVALQVLGILVHETFFVVGYPLVCLATFLHCSAHPNLKKSRHLLAMCIPPLALIVLIGAHACIDPSGLREQLKVRLSAFDFQGVHSEVLIDYQTRGLIGEFKHHSLYVFRRSLEPTVLAPMIIPLLSMVYLCHSVFRLKPFTRVSLILLATVLAPLSLHLVASDMMRISSYTLAGGFLAFWILTKTQVARDDLGLFPLLASTAILLNTLLRIPLMDNLKDEMHRVDRILFYAPMLLLTLYLLWRANSGGLKLNERK